MLFFELVCSFSLLKKDSVYTFLFVKSIQSVGRICSNVQLIENSFTKRLYVIAIISFLFRYVCIDALYSPFPRSLFFILRANIKGSSVRCHSQSCQINCFLNINDSLDYYNHMWALSAQLSFAQSAKMINSDVLLPTCLNMNEMIVVVLIFFSL